MSELPIENQPEPLGIPPERVIDSNEQYQPIPIRKKRPRRRWRAPGCGCLSLILVIAIAAAFIFWPARINLLLLGIDRPLEGTDAGRTDTMIVTSFLTSGGEVKMLSIPRDLWVTVPGYGENRINTAHYFAEIDQPGSGPEAAVNVVRQNFGLTLKYYARIKFDGLARIIDAMGGIRLELEEPTLGYPAGVVELNGEQALAFARERRGSDDFFRMAHGQMVIKTAIQQMLRPAGLVRLPAVVVAAVAALDTNVPVWLWPRLGFTLLRASGEGIDARTINREMVTSWMTADGAQVLLPNWPVINPVLLEMFGE